MIITCRELTELASDRREGALGFMQKSGVALHLSWCERCRRYVEQVDLAVAAAKLLHDEPPSDAAREELRARFRRRAGRSPA